MTASDIAAVAGIVSVVVALVGFGTMLWKGGSWTGRIATKLDNMREWQRSHDERVRLRDSHTPSGAANGEDKGKTDE